MRRLVVRQQGPERYERFTETCVCLMGPYDAMVTRFLPEFFEA